MTITAPSPVRVPGLLNLSLAAAFFLISFALPAPVHAQDVAAGANPDGPNLIFIIADDMAWNDSTPYGHPHIQTPNLARMAEEGLRFDQAFLTCSSCSPSRSSIITGRYPHATGAAELHQPLPQQPTFVKALKDAGYYTAQAGKWHLGNEIRGHFDRIEDKKTKGQPTDGSGCEMWLPVLKERPKDKPFFLWLASFDPHRGYQPNAIPEPHSREDIVVPPFLPDTPEVRDDLALYYDEISRMDGYLGRVLDELEAQGVAKNTLVLFTSDNGRPFPRCKTTVYDSGIRAPFIAWWPGRIEAGAVSASLVSSVDIAPTFLALAGVPAPDTLQGKSFASILEDPKATTRDYIFAEHNWHDYKAHKRAIRSDKYLYIHDSLPQLNLSPPADAVKSPTFQAMLKLRDEGKLNAQQMQCFEVPRPADELYDVQSDPYQFNNLAEDPAYADTLARMKSELSDWQGRTADNPSPNPDTLTQDTFSGITGEKLKKGQSPERP